MNRPDDGLRRLFTLTDEPSGGDPSGEVAPQIVEALLSPPASLPLLITKRQRAMLKELGFPDEAIGEMRPAEAHKHLGL
jgi:hypothetical protein